MRALALARDLIDANLGRGRRPFKLTLILNWACNCRCSMCGIWKKSDAASLDAAEVDRFFERNGHWSWINLSGGEILMNRDAEGIIASVVRRNRRLWLLDFPTTGHRPERLVGLVRTALEGGPRRVAVTVSLDGPAAVHESIRRAPGLFSRAMESMRGLRGLQDPRLVLRFGMTLSAANVGMVDETIEAAAREIPGLGPDDFHLNLAQTSEHYYGSADDASIAAGGHHAAALEAIRRHRGRVVGGGLVDRLEDAFQAGLETFLATGESPLTCSALRSSLYVDPEWNVHPCITWNRPLGNLRSRDFDLDALLSSVLAAETREGIRSRSCPDCWTACEAIPTLLSQVRAGFRLERAGRSNRSHRS